MDMKRFFLYAIVIAALALAGCGGNGGGGTDMADNGDDGQMPMQCPEGQTGTYPNCMTPPPPAPDCTLGGGGLECSEKVVAAPIADADGDGNFDGLPAGTIPTSANVTEALEKGRPNQPLTNNAFDANGVRPLKVNEGNKLAHSDGVEFAMSGMTPASLDSQWVGSMQMRTKEAKEDSPNKVEDMVTVYTDRENSKPQAYDEYFTDTTISGETNGANNGVTAVVAATGELTLAENVAGHHGLFMATYFPSASNQTRNYVDDNTATPSDETKAAGNAPRKFDGAFRGVNGEYECTGTCSAGTNAKGELTTLTGDWTFTPKAKPGDIMVMNVIPDADYMSFGYWVQSTTDRDGETTHGISTFTGGTLFPAAATDGSTAISSLLGSATYTGQATGLYVKKTYNQTANNFTVNSSGQFVADAKLTANFGGNEFGDASNFEVDGTINGFKDMNGDSIDNNWEITLNDAEFGSGDQNTFVGTTTTGAGSAPGVWNGAFYGVPVDRDGMVVSTNDAGTRHDDRAPTGVAGEFNAHFNPGGQDPGHVIGAFGARR